MLDSSLWAMMDRMGVAKTGAPSGTVTFLLTDVEGSSRLWEASAQDAATAITRHREILAAAIEQHGGFRPIEQGEGDSVVGAFERATDAARAACGAQLALSAEPWPSEGTVRVRMALHSGEVTAAPDGTYSGPVLNRCARLRALAHGGQVVMSESTRDLMVDQLPDDLVMRDLGTHRLRDLSRPEHVWQVTVAGLPESHPPLQSLDASPNNLPIELSSFIGRDEDVAYAAKLLLDTRLLTLTGSGGCGKTRLALRAAAEASGDFDDGVWWVALAPLADGGLIASTVAAAMGVRLPADRQAIDVVFGHLANRGSLVVLDNCEHLLESVATFVDQLLRAAPTAKVLATSREPLSVEGEVTWRVPSLTLPPPTATEPEALCQYDAVRLFIERAVQVRPSFAVDNHNAPAVAEICSRLDGIPLALELAAARTRVLTPERIAAELGDRFRLLTGGSRTALPRQQTLLASVDWSHDLLGADERAVFRRLGVFAGGFTLDAAEAVASAGGLGRYDVFDVLARLVSKSLVQLEEPHPGVGSGPVPASRVDSPVRKRPPRGGRGGCRDARPAPDLGDRPRRGAGSGCDECTARAAPTARRRALERSCRSRVGRSDRSRGRDPPACRSARPLLGASRKLRRGETMGHIRSGARLHKAIRSFSPAPGGPSPTQPIFGATLQPPGAWRTRPLPPLVSRVIEPTEARCLMSLGNTFLTEDPMACRSLVSEAAVIAQEAGDRWCEAHSLQALGVELHQRRAGPTTPSERSSGTSTSLPRWATTCSGRGSTAAWRSSPSFVVISITAKSSFRRRCRARRRVGDPVVELILVCRPGLLRDRRRPAGSG